MFFGLPHDPELCMTHGSAPAVDDAPAGSMGGRTEKNGHLVLIWLSRHGCVVSTLEETGERCHMRRCLLAHAPHVSTNRLHLAIWHRRATCGSICYQVASGSTGSSKGPPAPLAASVTSTARICTQHAARNLSQSLACYKNMAAPVGVDVKVTPRATGSRAPPPPPAFQTL